MRELQFEGSCLGEIACHGTMGLFMDYHWTVWVEKICFAKVRAVSVLLETLLEIQYSEHCWIWWGKSHFNFDSSRQMKLCVCVCVCVREKWCDAPAQTDNSSAVSSCEHSFSALLKIY